jgi:hypothetical protein
VWDDELVNLKVFLDGALDLSVLSANLGDNDGEWCWPKKV